MSGHYFLKGCLILSLSYVLIVRLRQKGRGAWSLCSFNKHLPCLPRAQAVLCDCQHVGALHPKPFARSLQGQLLGARVPVSRHPSRSLRSLASTPPWGALSGSVSEGSPKITCPEHSAEQCLLRDTASLLAALPGVSACLRHLLGLHPPSPQTPGLQQNGHRQLLSLLPPQGRGSR